MKNWFLATIQHRRNSRSIKAEIWRYLLNAEAKNLCWRMRLREVRVVMVTFRIMTYFLHWEPSHYSPLSHGGHIGYDVCTLGRKSRRCVSNLRFAAINHAKQRSVCPDVPLCSNNRSKGKLGIIFHRFSLDKYAKECWMVRIRGDVGKNVQVSDCGLRL